MFSKWFFFASKNVLHALRKRANNFGSSLSPLLGCFFQVSCKRIRSKPVFCQSVLCCRASALEISSDLILRFDANFSFSPEKNSFFLSKKASQAERNSA